MPRLLTASNVSKSFGGVQAVRDCTLAVETGKVTGLIGPNGAGKTTMLEMIAGGLTPDSGTISFNGQDIAGIGRTRVARAGMVRTFQMARPLASMPVIENVIIGHQQQIGEHPGRLFSRTWRSQERDLLHRAEECLEAVGLADKRSQLVLQPQLW